MILKLSSSYVYGKYKWFLNPKIPNIKPKTRKKPSTSLKVDNKKFFSNQLKFIVLKQLKTGSKQSAIKHGKVILSQSNLNFLQKRFNIGKRYKECIEILNYFDIPTERYINSNDYCKIRKFYVRIFQPARLKIYNSITCIQSAPYLSFKYLKSNEVIAN